MSVLMYISSQESCTPDIIHCMPDTVFCMPDTVHCMSDNVICIHDRSVNCKNTQGLKKLG